MIMTGIIRLVECFNPMRGMAITGVMAGAEGETVATTTVGVMGSAEDTNGIIGILLEMFTCSSCINSEVFGHT